MKYYKIEKSALIDIIRLTIEKSEEVKLPEPLKMFWFWKLKPINIRYSKEGLCINISIKVIFSKNLLSICEKITKEVKEQLEKKANIKVKDIYINLQGVYE